MEADAAVGGGDARIVAVSPRVDHTVDGPRIEVRPVGEDDDGGLDVLAERGEAAAQRCAGAAFPVVAAHGPRVGLDVMGAEYDDDVVDRAPAEPLEHTRKQHALLGRAKARRCPRREHHCRDHAAG